MPKKSLRNQMKILRGSRARFTMRPTKIPMLMTERDTSPSSMYPEDLEGIQDLKEYPETVCRGGSVIIAPLGEELAGPLSDSEGILYADLDLAQVVRSRFDFDVVGHYSRPDIFQLLVDERSKPSVLSRVGGPAESRTEIDETE